MDRDFALQPFPSGAAPALSLTGGIGRRPQTLAIHYLLAGRLAELVISASADTPVRKTRLWEQTCFELFVAVKNSPRYWEFNLSPAGHWNVFRFSSYRQGMQEETAFRVLPFLVRREADSLQLDVAVDLGKIDCAGQVLEIGISTVIKQTDGRTTYWALVHCGPQADFHRRDGFVIEL